MNDDWTLRSVDAHLLRSVTCTAHGESRAATSGDSHRDRHRALVHLAVEDVSIDGRKHQVDVAELGFAVTAASSGLRRRFFDEGKVGVRLLGFAQAERVAKPIERRFGELANGEGRRSAEREHR